MAVRGWGAGAKAEMNTKLLMTLSALFMGTIGIAASFLPQEIAVRLGTQPHPYVVLVLQIAGALYMGFAILNWMARDALIGGIYSRPVALGNFLHFAVVAIILFRALSKGDKAGELVAAAVIYAIFGIWFGLVLFRQPTSAK